jgi:hypothetical protein
MWLLTRGAEMRLILAVIVFVGAIVWVWWTYRHFSHPPKTEGHNPLTPDAERDARAKFLPSSDTAADDASIQPDKRNVKPGGPLTTAALFA